MKITKFLAIFFAASVALFSSCETPTPEEGGDKPTVTLTVDKTTGLAYGDEITVSGKISDAKGLRSYSVTLTDAAGTIIYQSEQNILGAEYDYSETFPIALPKNAAPGDITLKVSATNSAKKAGSTSEKLVGVAVPSFNKLYLILSNNYVLEMTKNGAVFETSDFIPAEITGRIYASSTKKGLYWGANEQGIASMVNGDITVGKTEASYFKVTFNPVTFELSTGDNETWTELPASDCYYVYGDISGADWIDGVVVTEYPNMKMKGYKNATNTQRYYAWIPPEGDATTAGQGGMWGACKAGPFRFKKGGAESYVLWNGSALTTGTTNDDTKSFYVSYGSNFEFRLYFTGTTCTKVQLKNATSSLEYTDAIKINGVNIPAALDFAGSPLNASSELAYSYSATVNLTKGQTINSAAMSLAAVPGDADLFSGIGNSEWTLTGPTGPYSVRLDMLSGAFYACHAGGYPEVLYLDGWSFAKVEAGPAIAWSGANMLCLTKNASGIYETTFYCYSWGGDFKLYVKHPVQSVDYGTFTIKFADAQTTLGIGTDPLQSFAFPVVAGLYKISVDLKDGLDIDDTAKTVVPKNGKKVGITITPL